MATIAALCLPIITVIVLTLSPTENIWPQLWGSVLPGYIGRTLALLLGVGFLSLVIGTAGAWLVTFCEFPGRKFFMWAALTPLAMPTYIISYTYVDFLTYSGALQSHMRHVMGWTKPSDYWFPEIRSLGGAIVILSFVLAPYVYMAGRVSFLSISNGQLDVARTLGSNGWRVFRKIALPQARPGLMVGLSLVLMECLNDIAAVGFFGVETLTFGIYATWLGQGNLGGAAQLSFVLLVFVFALISAERFARRHTIAQDIKTGSTQPDRYQLRGGGAVLAILSLLVPLLIGFILPAVILCRYAARRLELFVAKDFLTSTFHSLSLAAIATAITLLFALLLVYNHRNSERGWFQTLIRLATTGYAIPGTVLGLGVLIPLAGFDNWLDGRMQNWFGFSSGLILTGSIFAIVFAYVIRFMAIGFGNLVAGFKNITPNIDAAARTLGRGPRHVIFNVHLPLLRPALFSAGLLIFVDAMKELPATLILRPFDFETLATQVFMLASLDQLEESSVPALTIVIVGLIPIYFLARQFSRPQT